MTQIDTRMRAFRNLQTAHYILTFSYPNLREEKLLISALNHLYFAFQEGLNSLSISKGEEFSPNIPTMKKFIKEHSISPLSLEVFQQIHELISLHEKSPVEFARKENFVICSENYELSLLSPEKLHEFLLITEQFLNSVDRVLLNRET